MARIKIPRVIFKEPWWWNDFILKLAQGKIYAKGDKGEKGDPGGLDASLSMPPPGCKKVRNLYVNRTGKLVVEYEDNPD